MIVFLPSLYNFYKKFVENVTEKQELAINAEMTHHVQGIIKALFTKVLKIIF